ncbi:ADP-ribosylation factor-like protein 4D [Brachionichthys hirsutus]|uniref:ADP-ribosylation factor-like protein 4D n=1 Tax=Brachionichthys hirsutus TaxID=412623 RepID=UPI003604AAB7
MGNQLTDMAPAAPSFLPNLQCLHVVVVGLDSAGKTSLLYRLKLKEFVKTIPTKGFNAEKIKVAVAAARTVNFQVWDVGGQEKLRPLWKSYTRRTDGMVFVVDSAEPERMEEAKVELHKISRTSENQGVPVLVLANKQDLDSASPVAEVEKLLAVRELSAHTPSHVQSCSAVDGRGLQAGLEKLYEMILKRRKTMKRNGNRKR